MVRIFFSSLLLLQFVCVLPVAVSAQSNPSVIKSAAIAMGNALVKKNSEQFLSYMHPSMIKAAMPDISPALVIPKAAAPKIIMKEQ